MQTTRESSSFVERLLSWEASGCCSLVASVERINDSRSNNLVVAILALIEERVLRETDLG
jgi:hypothetical protein